LYSSASNRASATTAPADRRRPGPSSQVYGRDALGRNQACLRSRPARDVGAMVSAGWRARAHSAASGALAQHTAHDCWCAGVLHAQRLIAVEWVAPELRCREQPAHALSTRSNSAGFSNPCAQEQRRTRPSTHWQRRDVATLADRVHELPPPVIAVLAHAVEPDHRGLVGRGATAQRLDRLDVLEHVGGLVVRLLLMHAPQNT
jgi:hypothetical protein